MLLPGFELLSPSLKKRLKGQALHVFGAWSVLRCYKELVATYEKLEKHYRDMQDIEFTIENGQLWMLQTRNGKRTAKAAALRIATDMIDEKLIDAKRSHFACRCLEALINSYTRLWIPDSERTTDCQRSCQQVLVE